MTKNIYHRALIHPSARHPAGIIQASPLHHLCIYACGMLSASLVAVLYVLRWMGEAW